MSTTTMARPTRRDVRDLLAWAEATFGAEYRGISRGGHIVVSIPGAPKPIYLAQTPSDPRSMKNARALIQRTARHVAAHTHPEGTP